MDLREYIEKEPARRVGYRAPVVVGPETSIGDAAALMRERSVGCLLVGEDGRLSGIFTERDLLRKVLAKQAEATFEDPITAVMTSNPVVALESETIAVLLRRMYDGGFRHIPLLSGNDRLLGTVSIKRVVGFLADQFGEHVYNQPPRLDNYGSAREGG